MCSLSTIILYGAYLFSNSADKIDENQMKKTFSTDEFLITILSLSNLQRDK